MKNFIIPTNSQLELMHEGTMGYFCLAQHYYNNEEYRNFFKEAKAAGHHILLDNGAGDHALITEDILIWCLKDLMPNEVIPPDYLFDKERTIDGLESFISRLIQENLLGKVELLFCPQGNTKEEWLECYLEGLRNSHITTIGFSKLGIPHAFLGQAKDDQGIMKSRHECVDLLLETNLIQKPIHFLGAENPNEFIKYKELNNPLFRSTDSCFSCWSGMNGLDWNKGEFQRIPTPKDYFERPMNEEQISLAKSNIAWFKNLLK